MSRIRWIGWAAIGVILIAVSAVAQTPTVTSLGYCQLTATGSSQGLSACTGGIPSGVKLVNVTVSGANIRYRDDGPVPTATVGIPVLQGQTLIYQGRPIQNFKFIAQSGSPILDIDFYGD